MASAAPGLAQVAASAEDPSKGMVEDGKDGLVEQDHPIAPDQYDERFETSRWEIWAYYSYYIGVSLTTSTLPTTDCHTHDFDLEQRINALQLRAHRSTEPISPTSRSDRRPRQHHSLLRWGRPHNQQHRPSLQRHQLRDPDRHLPHPRLLRRFRHLPAQHPHRTVPRSFRDRFRLAGRPL